MRMMKGFKNVGLLAAIMVVMSGYSSEKVIAGVGTILPYDFFTIGEGLESNFIGFDMKGDISKVRSHPRSYISNHDLTVTPSGRYYGIGNYDIFEIAPITGEVTKTGRSDTLLRGIACSDDNEFYVTKMPAQSFPSALGILDMETGEYDHSLYISGEADFIGEIAFSPISGKLYGWGHYNSTNIGIYHIEPETGETKLVLPQSSYQLDGVGGAGGFAFAPDGTLYLAGYEIGSQWPDYDYSLVLYNLDSDSMQAKLSLNELKWPDLPLGCIAVVPEPGSCLLLLAGGIAVRRNSSGNRLRLP